MMKRYNLTVPFTQQDLFREDPGGEYVKLLDYLPQGLLDSFLYDVKSEVLRARAKFPTSEASMTALTEEVGELAKALMDESSQRVFAEAMQVACMAARVALEGDPTLDEFRRARGVGPHPDVAVREVFRKALSTRKVVYIAHRLSGDREANRKAAVEWVSWAGKLGFAPSATWTALAEVWDEETGRELGLAIDFAHIERSDFMFQCGPQISEGMFKEEEHAHAHGVTVFNLIGKDFQEAEEFLQGFGVVE